MSEWAEAIERSMRRLDSTMSTCSTGFPHFADQTTGAWTATPDGDWTGGFFTGQLWLACTVLGLERFRSPAQRWTRRMLPRASSATVFRGFLFWYGAALGDVLGADPIARSVAVEGALGLAGSYDAVGKVLPLGVAAEESHTVGPHETNIDGVPGGTPLLAWAARVTERSDLRHLALTSAERHIELCVRDDGSVCQSATFDPTTGEVVRRYTHKGVHDDSTWTRAQAWGLLGFAQAAVIDPDRFTAPLRAVADWWIDHLPATMVAYWDFDDPAIPHAPIDTSGTAIAAAALLKANVALGGHEIYRRTAQEMASALVSDHLSPDGILGDGCYNNRIGLATRNELIWGNYFLLEALCVLDGVLDTTSV